MSDTLDIETNIDEAVTLLTTDRLELIVPDLSYLSVMLDHMEKNKEHFKTSSPRAEKFELLSILVYGQNIIRRPSCLIVQQPVLRLQT